jgi:hypothetical protein
MLNWARLAMGKAHLFNTKLDKHFHSELPPHVLPRRTMACTSPEDVQVICVIHR